ncbi:MAG: hypothetical protein ACXWBO_16510, partial [Ilumatobacteraceae bacterium]
TVDAMRWVEGSTWECTWCGTLFTLPGSARPRTMTVVSNDEPPRRVIRAAGREVHACTEQPDRRYR